MRLDLCAQYYSYYYNARDLKSNNVALVLQMPSTLLGKIRLVTCSVRVVSSIPLIHFLIIF